MKRFLPQTDNQQGSLMVFALLITATLTIAGIMVANDTLMESRIARNFAINKQCFRAAEAAALEMGQEIDNLSKDDIMGRAWSYDGLPGTGWTFNAADFRAGAYNTRNSNLAGVVNYIGTAEAVLELSDYDPPSSFQGFGGQSLYTFTIYSRATHLGPRNVATGINPSESMIMLGYRRWI